ncbi:hypothetical protein RB597_006676 [Gaeumannomyces tritici]
MADDLDSIVKGAPLPGREEVAKSVGGTSPVSAAAAVKPGDPLVHTPSSPSMIYLNLLVLEASLRAQYLELRARRRHHGFFLTLLTLWTVGFGYALFFAPREDGRGIGGSVYWVVEVAERVCFMGGVITVILVWATGIWDRGVRWPRRWFNISNRGLRGFNLKLVADKRPWWAEAFSTFAWIVRYGIFSSSGGHPGSSYRWVDPFVLREVDAELKLSAQGHPVLPIVSEDEERVGGPGMGIGMPGISGMGGMGGTGSMSGHEEDLAPGGDYVKLLLLAKPFSPTFRENWELYRTEYWERENERRALMGVKLKERDRRLRKERGGWLWWLPWYRVVETGPPAGVHHLHHHHHHHHHHHQLVSEKGSLASRHGLGSELREHRRSRSGSVRRGSMSNSNTPSRSPTPTVEIDEAVGGGGSGVSRRASTASNASEIRRKKNLSTSGSQRSQKRPESRSVTPDIPSPLAKEAVSGSPGKEATSPGGDESVRQARKSSSRSPAPSISSRE